MRCDCCNNNLSDYETSLKSLTTGNDLFTCLKCLKGLNIQYTGNKALQRNQVDESFEEDHDYDWDEEDEDYFGYSDNEGDGEDD